MRENARTKKETIKNKMKKRCSGSCITLHSFMLSSFGHQVLREKKFRKIASSKSHYCNSSTKRDRYQAFIYGFFMKKCFISYFGDSLK
mmetsp:Transcript_8575/g.21086  ORF Transcript_8575/g.21086 Transcript_8575/m.21086 type:complete len:88 (+) Transcript_8575:1718-1981(+)